MAEEIPSEESGGFLYNLVLEIIQSPLNIALVLAIAFLAYKILKRSNEEPVYSPPEPQLPKLRKDFTPEELKPYNGTQEDGRVLMAVNGNVYDVTKGKRFYGPGGPYAAFAGRDASRGLATFSVECKTDGYDDLSDLNSMEMDSVLEWEAQFKEKYDLVGRLLKPGEEPRNYSDDEDEEDSSGTSANVTARTGDSGGGGDKPKSE
ncbi:hypothetical protein PPYR_06973 [Photinus pyralis]|uniref:Cytochrome b5 heme-binding domain-containing protein n=1 Tax=Photinus pyralis TaxID=7054 RepID=A0A1Y1KZN4_PHOPY|nr:membrane-associated progesterone receptor component 1-like [Photinus pyralis]KAB0799093.1 hypothetical protein PPYR_06973 [Photinus pyralis]